jgi:hypothetical protein
VRGFNSWRSNPFKRSKRVVFSLDTPDGLTIAIRNAEQWLALRTHPPLDLLGADLPAMLRRECRAAGLLLDDCQIQTLPWLPKSPYSTTPASRRLPDCVMCTPLNVQGSLLSA